MVQIIDRYIEEMIIENSNNPLFSKLNDAYLLQNLRISHSQLFYHYNYNDKSRNMNVEIDI